MQIVLQRISDILETYTDRSQILELNTWGDAIILVSDDIRFVARFALEYRDITKGTQYDPSRPRTGAYRRDPAREAMVVGGLKKLRLFEE